MDDFLYIIIGVIWVIYSLYSNKQKQDKKRAMRDAQTQGGAPPQEIPRPRSFLEEILMGDVNQPQPLYDEVEEFEEVKEVEKVKKAEGGHKYKSMADTYNAKTRSVESGSLEKIVEEVPLSYFDNQYAMRNRGESVERMDQNQILKEDEEISHERVGYFDLKTAVIYAEILNLRYV